MPENLTRQILREHLTDGELTPGEALTFEDEADYERAKGGGLRIEESGDEFSVTHDFAPKERDILVSGGLLHYLSENAPA
jgi:hypothetical protein